MVATIPRTDGKRGHKYTSHCRTQNCLIKVEGRKRSWEVWFWGETICTEVKKKVQPNLRTQWNLLDAGENHVYSGYRTLPSSKGRPRGSL